MHSYRKLAASLGQVNPTLVLRLPDNAVIPFDPGNIDYQAYLTWLEEGNPPDEELIDKPVVTSVSARQARLALDAAGLLDNIEAALGALPKSAQIEWEYANEVRRDSSLIAVVASALSLSDAQIDGLFAVAAEL